MCAPATGPADDVSRGGGLHAKGRAKGLVGRRSQDYSDAPRHSSLRMGSNLLHRFRSGQLFRLGSALVLGFSLLPACTLITDVDREDIPPPSTPVFPRDDAGRDAATDPVTPPPVDAGRIPDAGNGGDLDSGLDAGALLDAASDASADAS